MVEVLEKNPIILTEDEIGEQQYTILCNAVSEQQNISALRLLEEKIVISDSGKNKSYKYPENPSLEWVLQKVRCEKVKAAKRTITKYEYVLRVFKDVVIGGGFVYIDGNTLIGNSGETTGDNLIVKQPAIDAFFKADINFRNEIGKLLVKTEQHKLVYDRLKRAEQFLNEKL